MTATRQHSRTPPPRQLLEDETLSSLTHWRTSFRTFYKKDEAYRPFFLSGFSWNPSATNYGLVAETDGLKRTAADKCEDLIDLLGTLAGYLPHSYITDKLISSTANWEDVFNIIYEHYGVQVTSESFLDFEKLNKRTEETHRQFFERLVQHTRLHSSGEKEQLSTSLKNMIALQWLRKTNSRLIDIIRTEYSTELRANTPLVDLVPRIAVNIDSLLLRYDQHNAIQRVGSHEAGDNTTVHATWNKNSYKSNSQGSKFSQNANNKKEGLNTSTKSKKNRGPFCPGCYYMAQQLDCVIHFRHLPAECPRKKVTVRMIQMEDQEYFCDEEHQNEENGNFINGHFKSHDENFQIQNVKLEDIFSPQHISYGKQFLYSSEPIYKSVISDENMETALSLSVQNGKNSWNVDGLRKSSSPKILVSLFGLLALATIDEGSEINCIDERLAVEAKLKFKKTNCRANGAGSHDMKLAGQTEDDILLRVCYNGGKEVTLNVGKMVIVKDLGANFLLGEPCKKDHSI